MPYIYIYKFGSNGTTLESQYEEYQFCKFFNCTYSVISNVSDLKLQSVIVNKDKPGVYINSSDIVDACDRLKEHFDSTFNGTGGSTGGTKGGPSGKTPEGNYTYDVLIGNKYTTITLDAPLTEGSKADTDGDGIPDWEEMNKLYSFDFIFNEGYADSIFRNIVTNPTEREQLFNSLRGRNVYVITSDPTKIDSDGDGIKDKEDPEKMNKFDIKAFGTFQYAQEVNEKADKWYSDTGSRIKSLKLIKNDILIDCYDISDAVAATDITLRLDVKATVARKAIEFMMEDVDNCEEYIRYNEKYNKYDPEGEWTKFCKFFNSKVQTYGNVDKELHYFRLKLNRAPKTLEDMISLINSSEEDDKWTLYSMKNTRYHMFGTDGEYNLKFGSSKNTDYMYEAVYNKDGILLTEYNSPINMGTYNYCSDQADGDLHQKLDVAPYKAYGNTPNPSSKYPGNDAKEENERKYNNNTSAQNNRLKYEKEIS